MADVTHLGIPADAPHPVMGCRCGEGRVVTAYATRQRPPVVQHWLPAVHDCEYIAARNRRLGLV